VLVPPLAEPDPFEFREMAKLSEESLAGQQSLTQNRSEEFVSNHTNEQADREILPEIFGELPPASIPNPLNDTSSFFGKSAGLNTGLEARPIPASGSPSAEKNSLPARSAGISPILPRYKELDPAELETEQALVQSRVPRGPATSFSLFGGPSISGRKFVFVLDRSASMDSTADQLMRLSTEELSKALAALNEAHDFQIMAYNQRTVTLTPPDLLPASEEHKARAIPFLRNLPSVGGTNHLGALYHAISYRPDAILFFSDGGEPFLSKEALRQIRSQTGGTIQIHCFEFGLGIPEADQPSGFMQALARQNRGTYLYIDVGVVSKYNQ